LIRARDRTRSPSLADRSHGEITRRSARTRTWRGAPGEPRERVPLRSGADHRHHRRQREGEDGHGSGGVAAPSHPDRHRRTWSRPRPPPPPPHPGSAVARESRHGSGGSGGGREETQWSVRERVDDTAASRQRSLVVPVPLSHYYQLPSHSRVAPRSENHMLALAARECENRVYDLSGTRVRRARWFRMTCPRRVPRGTAAVDRAADTWIGGPTVQWECDPVGVAVSGVCIRSGRGMAREAVTDWWARTGRRRIYVLCSAYE
jgi:hypothetical protein